MSTDPVTEVFAANLRRLRKELRLTSPALGRAAGVDAGIIRRLEDSTASTTLLTAGKIAAALGSTVREMLAPEDEEMDCG